MGRDWVGVEWNMFQFSFGCVRGDRRGLCLDEEQRHAKRFVVRRSQIFDETHKIWFGFVVFRLWWLSEQIARTRTDNAHLWDHGVWAQFILSQF